MLGKMLAMHRFVVGWMLILQLLQTIVSLHLEICSSLAVVARLHHPLFRLSVTCCPDF